MQARYDRDTIALQSYNQTDRPIQRPPKSNKIDPTKSKLQNTNNQNSNDTNDTNNIKTLDKNRHQDSTSIAQPTDNRRMHQSSSESQRSAKIRQNEIGEGQGKETERRKRKRRRRERKRKIIWTIRTDL